MHQMSDDTAREVNDVWLGAKGHRWAWTWTYSEWALAFGVFVFGGTLVTWVVPSGLLVGYGAHRFARWASLQQNPDEPRNAYRWALGLIIAGCLLYSLNPFTWIKPLPLLVALALSCWLPFRAVKVCGRFVDWNRPLNYWVRLPRLVSTGPREQAPIDIDPTPLWGSPPASHDTEGLKPGQGRPYVETRWGFGKEKIFVDDQETADMVNYWSGNGPKPKSKPVKAKIHSLPRQAYIQRVPGGLRVGNTEIQMGERQ